MLMRAGREVGRRAGAAAPRCGAVASGAAQAACRRDDAAAGRLPAGFSAWRGCWAPDGQVEGEQQVRWRRRRRRRGGEREAEERGVLPAPRLKTSLTSGKPFSEHAASSEGRVEAPGARPASSPAAGFRLLAAPLHPRPLSPPATAAGLSGDPLPSGVRCGLRRAPPLRL